MLRQMRLVFGKGSNVVRGGIVLFGPIPIFDVSVNRGGLNQAVATIRSVVDGTNQYRQRLHVITLNPEYIMRAREDETLRSILNEAFLRVADGVGVVIAARVLDPLAKERRRIPHRLQSVNGVSLLVERVTGNDLVAALADAGTPLFLLGAAEGVAAEAAAALRERHPNAQIAGTWAGDAGPGDDEEARWRISATDARVVLVAYGMPKQDYWIARNLPHLNAPVAIGVGGAFDFLSGRVPRAPRFLRRAGLEWAYRLVRQPWRWRRILVVWRFAGLVLVEAARQRVRRVTYKGER